MEEFRESRFWVKERQEEKKGDKSRIKIEAIGGRQSKGCIRFPIILRNEINGKCRGRTISKSLSQTHSLPIEYKYKAIDRERRSMDITQSQFKLRNKGFSLSRSFNKKNNDIIKKNKNLLENMNKKLKSRSNHVYRSKPMSVVNSEHELLEISDGKKEFMSTSSYSGSRLNSSMKFSTKIHTLGSLKTIIKRANLMPMKNKQIQIRVGKDSIRKNRRLFNELRECTLEFYGK
ncbi:unnamed protein product [Moneuplotes crassus]|uniref:Uncharacterized protein n=1 Tax=Euplotes crassus TaxID=5936 RepID=A0AAD1XU34_EUPCR|nr:unnamed protein product [Moneuplotes crassus]